MNAREGDRKERIKKEKEIASPGSSINSAAAGVSRSWGLNSEQACTFAVLSCAYPQKLEQEHLSQKRDALPLYRLLLQPHPVLSHGVLLPTILGSNYPQSLTGSTVIQLSVGNQ